MVSYEISSNAKEDLRRIYRYGFNSFGELRADQYFWGFFKTFENISLNPLNYQSVDHIRLGYRRCVYGSDSIYFRVKQDGMVEIMAVLGGQDTDEWL
ncbi:type II toxin-antitoxin system RelE/ParE family toxin [Alteromonas sp. LMIT006]|jgi:toxin ParE1/3/4|uniref:type II toxin-antitoxin system RelE/ParE family toxin n=1 Tax=Alteromonadaceae TaxID=72275 RepID=UPI0020CA3FE6|nr:type II toxin-antitoxin system RelE/ParE family toxin [Alteromonas sp. LMIT006]UTP73249.1 type II toxin-antitoxin system RelE/ParE family toxin [Alteromonas sp. LMIT006]